MTPRPSKTGRVRGVIFRTVRAFARTHPQFTCADIPGLTRMQSLTALHGLLRNGELRVVEQGKPGCRTFKHGVFAATEKLRAPELTNQLSSR